MQTIKLGSKWLGNDRKAFDVLAVVERDGHVWVHYRDQQGREYSCYQESFLLRFSEHVN
jgi:hypothetical protein